jgi:hypothetical protein
MHSSVTSKKASLYGCMHFMHKSIHVCMYLPACMPACLPALEHVCAYARHVCTHAWCMVGVGLWLGVCVCACFK